ncbi:MAG: BlaI/MecI/CopY family transcriptional regulator [Candidatus Eremiobacteraeota bacterium]|nr:BlaI/MecI/CopY family transcriptional regulator [Candidatus Eremiobacteraeota bacterium]MBV8499657.1 BlaI/MecI/CopY family transcriptional regulator [Candidatus Eremiobacteraeota bacterium]
MARRRSATLTEAELRLMEVLWQRGQATVAEVTAALPPPPIAYNSVLTTMRILERKGYVAHDEAGRAFIYRPLLGREEAAGHAVGHVLSRFFDNSAGSLALRLIENERPSGDELARLKALIEEYEENGK